MIRRLLLTLLLLAAPLGATQSPHFFDIMFRDLVTPCEPGRLFGINNSTATSTCGGGGAVAAICQCDADGLGYSAAWPGFPDLEDMTSSCADGDLFYTETGQVDCSSLWNDQGNMVTYFGPFTIDPTLNTNVLTLDRHTTQTYPVIRAQASGGGQTFFSLEGNGDLFTEGVIGIGDGETAGGSVCIESDGADRLFHDTDCDGVKDAGERYIDDYVAGASTEIQLNNVGLHGSSATFTYNIASNTLMVGSGRVGEVVVDGILAAGNGTLATSACVAEDGSDRLFHDTDCDDTKDAGEEYIDFTLFSPTDLDTDYGNETITSDYNFGTGTLEVPNSGTRPGTCTVGMVYQDTDESSTAQWYVCTSLNTWTLQGGTGDVLAVGDCISGSCFSGSQGANLTFETAGAADIILAAASSAGGNTVTLPDETGTVCTTASVCAGYSNPSDGPLEDVQLSDGSGGFVNARNTLKYDQANEILVVAQALLVRDSIGIGSDVAPANAVCISDDGSDRLFHDTDCDEVKDAGEFFIDTEAHASTHEDTGGDEVAVTGGMMNADFGDFTCDGTATGCTIDQPQKMYYRFDSAHLANPNRLLGAIPRPAGGNDAGTNVQIRAALYDPNTDECGGTNEGITMPGQLATGDSVNFRAYWYFAISEPAGRVVVWDLRHLAVGAGESWDQAHTTEAKVSGEPGNTIDRIVVTSWAETVSNLGWAANDIVSIFLCRDADNGSDNLGQDARVLLLEITIPVLN